MNTNNRGYRKPQSRDNATGDNLKPFSGRGSAPPRGSKRHVGKGKAKRDNANFGSGFASTPTGHSAQLSIFGARKIAKPEEPTFETHSGGLTADPPTLKHKSTIANNCSNSISFPPLSREIVPELVNKKAETNATPVRTIGPTTMLRKAAARNVKDNAFFSLSKGQGLNFFQRNFKLIDSKMQWCCTKEKVPYFNQSNSDFLVVGVVGEQDSGKSRVLNALAGQALFETMKLEEDKEFCHLTHGVNGAFGVISGERVLFLDCQPIFSTSVLLDLALESTVSSEYQGSHVALAAVQDLRLISFLLSVCDTLLLVEDSRSVAHKALWRLLRYGYLTMRGDSLTNDVADVVLLRNRVDECDLANLKTLRVQQYEWIQFFDDIVPPSALHPRFCFVAFGEFSDPRTAENSPELLFLRRVILTNSLSSCNDEGNILDTFCPKVNMTMRTSPYGPLGLSFVDETSEEALAVEKYHIELVAPTAYSHYHALHRESHILQGSTADVIEAGSLVDTGGLSEECGTDYFQTHVAMRSERLDELGWLDKSSQIWCKELLGSVQMQEFIGLFYSQESPFIF